MSSRSPWLYLIGRKWCKKKTRYQQDVTWELLTAAEAHLHLWYHNKRPSLHANSSQIIFSNSQRFSLYLFSMLAPSPGEPLQRAISHKLWSGWLIHWAMSECSPNHRLAYKWLYLEPFSFFLSCKFGPTAETKAETIWQCGHISASAARINYLITLLISSVCPLCCSSPMHMYLLINSSGVLSLTLCIIAGTVCLHSCMNVAALNLFLSALTEQLRVASARGINI